MAHTSFRLLLDPAERGKLSTGDVFEHSRATRTLRRDFGYSSTCIKFMFVLIQ